MQTEEGESPCGAGDASVLHQDLLLWPLVTRHCTGRIVPFTSENLLGRLHSISETPP